MMKNLFIDTNIWLSLYHFTNDDLNQFNKLKELLHKDIKLYVPQQVKDEIARNREAKLKDALEKFNIQDINYPVFCKAYDEYESISEELKQLKRKQEAWRKKIESDIAEEVLPADIVIKELLVEADVIACER